MSLGRTARKASPIASIRPSTVRAAADRSPLFSFENILSIGLRSGL
jgi:hypothetical protein